MEGNANIANGGEKIKCFDSECAKPSKSDSESESSYCFIALLLEGSLEHRFVGIPKDGTSNSFSGSILTRKKKNCKKAE